eukprot:scaffold1907_cov142-Skeletonema_menzelii.AAC.3
MPSKTKKNKARSKAAKKADEQQRTLETQMERLKTNDDSQTNADEDALLEEAIKLAAAEKEELEATAAEKEGQLEVACFHGYHVETEAEDNVNRMFSETFFSALMSHRSTFSDFGVCLGVAAEAAMEKYPDVMNDPSKLKLVVTFLLSSATQLVLEGDFDKARRFAALAPYFEFLAVKIGEKVKLNKTAMLELSNRDDEHTLVKYLRKRIPCCCLDKKYDEVKSITRTGLCFNFECSLPNRMAERSAMLTCARCGDANYCSRKCQKADWPKHKKYCLW